MPKGVILSVTIQKGVTTLIHAKITTTRKEETGACRGVCDLTPTHYAAICLTLLHC
jgi:hypothetical protein